MSLAIPSDFSSETIRGLIADSPDDIVFITDPRAPMDPNGRTFDRMRQVMDDSGAGLVYSDSVGHPRIDYQFGSIRDNFDFGSVVAVSREAARECASDGAYRWGGLYDLRLRISERHRIVRIPEALYASPAADGRTSGEKQFDYVDPRNREYQVEMEAIATEHLRRIGAWLEPRFSRVPVDSDRYVVEATVVIPVRNRERTIGEAIQSVLTQETDFSFNVIVVDNHSTDRTGEVVRGFSDSRVLYVTPARRDLGIGGCWNEAVFSDRCGRYAIQLDSDDLYSSTSSLRRMVGELRAGPCAMVVGAYTMVNFALETIPPGVVDHREWTRENGRNNALRINGFGAPRGFATSIVRRFGFPDVSYGEDYAVGLRISREFEIGRVWEPVYLCRRWEGNTDSALPVETANRYDLYKDWIRSNEMWARQRY